MRKISFFFMILCLAGIIQNIPAQSTTQVTDTLPSTITLCGVFPIVQRPDAGPDRRDAFLMAIDAINNQTGQ